MQGPAHIGIGWVIGVAGGLRSRRDRRIVGLAGLAPDIDILVYPAAWLSYGFDLDRAFALYANVHHRYTHGIAFVVLAAVVAWRMAAGRRGLVALLTALAVVAHVVCDVIASGPAWPVHPLWPWHDWAWSVAWSWNASDPRNIAVSAAAVIMMLGASWKRGYSPLECFSYRADDWMASVMRGEFEASPRFRLVLYSSLALVSVAVLLPLWFYLR